MQKAHRAQQAGAVAVVVVDTDDTPNVAVANDALWEMKHALQVRRRLCLCSTDAGRMPSWLRAGPWAARAGRAHRCAGVQIPVGMIGRSEGDALKRALQSTSAGGLAAQIDFVNPIPEQEEVRTNAAAWPVPSSGSSAAQPGVLCSASTPCAWPELWLGRFRCA